MKKLVLIGAGGMASDYAAVLNALWLDFDVVCRSQASADAFTAKHGKVCLAGGISQYLETEGVPSHAIISVEVENLFEVTKKVLITGIKNILIEKPAALLASEIDQLQSLAKARGANVFVAYNRRFYSSVQKLREMVNSDGGMKSIHFDFTEWSDGIAELKKVECVKQRWVLSNSTHVIDLAFYLAGTPTKLDTNISGSMIWHPRASRFSGSGITDLGVVFSYRADWDAPGRWSVTAYSKNFKFDLCPLEKLNVTKRNSTDLLPVDVDDRIDLDFKPGLFDQVNAFLTTSAQSQLCKLAEHQKLFRSYLKMAGYDE